MFRYPYIQLHRYWIFAQSWRTGRVLLYSLLDSPLLLYLVTVIFQFSVEVQVISVIHLFRCAKIEKVSPQAEIVTLLEW